MDLEGRIQSELPWYKALLYNPVSYAKRTVIDPVDGYLLTTAARLGDWIERRSEKYDRHDIASWGGVGLLVGKVVGSYLRADTSSLSEASLEEALSLAAVSINVLLFDTAALVLPTLRFLERSYLSGFPGFRYVNDAFLNSAGIQSFRKFARCLSGPLMLGIFGYYALDLAPEYVRGGEKGTLFLQTIGALTQFLAGEAIIYLDSTDKNTVKKNEK